MKLQPAKHHQVEKTDSKDVYKTEKSVFDRSSPHLTTVSHPAQSSGAFARILEENRKNDAKDNGHSAKTEATDRDGDHLKSEKESKSEKAREERAEERREREGGGSGTGTGSGGQGDEGQSQSSAMIALQTHGASTSDAAPAARSILHIADLERIVSTIRTETFRKQKTVQIALKNSVLKGLEIKLTFDENGRVRAEFVASDETVRKQLRQRRGELAEILGNRSKAIATVEIGGEPQT